MRRSSVAAELEIVDLDGAQLDQPGTRAGQSRRRRWPVGLIAGVFAVVGLAVPGRTQVAATEFRRLDQAWTEFAAEESGHRDAIASVWRAALAPDQVLVNKAILNLDDEESERLVALDRRLSGMLLVDGRVSRLRAAMRGVVGQRVTVLRNAMQIRLRSQMGPIQSVESGLAEAPEIDRVTALLSSARDRFGLTRIAAPARIQPYRSADAVLAAMTSDQREARRAANGLAVVRPHSHGRIPLPF